MPQPLDRRMTGGRRDRNFQSRPWWLSIEYCIELGNNPDQHENSSIEQFNSGDPQLKS